MPRICFIDTETWNEVTDINAGTYAYAATCDITVITWKEPGKPAQVWDRTASITVPQDLLDLLRDPDVVFVAHNALFDRNVMHHVLKMPLDPNRWMCNQAKAQSCSLPGSLEKVGDALGLGEDQAKIKDGKKLVLKFCKPAPKNHKIRRYNRENSPEEWAAFLDYAKRDVEALETLWNQIPNFNYRGTELALWRLDQKINDRGVPVDLELARAAIRATEAEKARLKEVVREETNDQVGSFSQRDLLLNYLNTTYGLGLDDLRTSTLETVLDQVDLPSGLRDILYARLRGSKASTAKYKKLIKATNEDGRLRGLLRFNGASRTGRWSGQVFQPQNLPRPSHKSWDIKVGIDAMKGGYESWMYGDDVMDLASSALRGVIVAPEGRKLPVSDLSNIEGRVLAWLAGEPWKLDAFRRYDTLVLGPDGKPILDKKGEPLREGHDLYILAYAGSFGVSPESVTKDQRQVGKVQELALGYQGGVGAFLTFAAAYGIDLEEMGAKAYATLPADVREESSRAWIWALENKMTHGLSENAWAVCDGFKRLWRRAHPNVVAFWGEIEAAVKNAIKLPDHEFTARKVTVRYAAPWLGIKLPSGRILFYFQPEMRTKGKRELITYMGINQFNRQWKRLSTYGGKLVENITQAVARDVLAAAMFRVEDEGYEILLSVHDELITSAPDTEEFNDERLSMLLAVQPEWAQDLPLAAGGFTDYRYRKG